MTLELFKLRCRECGTLYEAPLGPPHSYGEFLMYSTSTDNLRYLNTFSEDSAFDEVDKLLGNMKSTSGKTDLELGEILQDVFGVVCDPNVDGSEFSINREPDCPSCGSSESKEYDSIEPPRCVEIDVAPVTHKLWDALSPQEKRQRINDALDRLGVV